MTSLHLMTGRVQQLVFAPGMLLLFAGGLGKFNPILVVTAALLFAGIVAWHAKKRAAH